MLFFFFSFFLLQFKMANRSIDSSDEGELCRCILGERMVKLPRKAVLQMSFVRIDVKEMAVFCCTKGSVEVQFTFVYLS